MRFYSKFGGRNQIIKKKNPETIAVSGFLLAEKEGFEPSRPFRGLHDFQSCALDQLGDFSIVVPVQFRYAIDCQK